MSEKIWFITGASRGFGRIWAEDNVGGGTIFHFTIQSGEPEDE